MTRDVSRDKSKKEILLVSVSEVNNAGLWQQQPLVFYRTRWEGRGRTWHYCLYPRPKAKRHLKRQMVKLFKDAGETGALCPTMGLPRMSLCWGLRKLQPAGRRVTKWSHNKLITSYDSWRRCTTLNIAQPLLYYPIPASPTKSDGAGERQESRILNLQG